MTLKIKYLIFLAAAVFSLPLLASAQKQTGKKLEDAVSQSFRRMTTKTERVNFGVGGTITIAGAPTGSVIIEGWNNREVEVTADIEVEAPTGEDLELLARVNNFVLDTDTTHISVLTTGTHDRDFLKKNFKNFPKKLLGLPWRADYRIKVPAYTDLEINMGRGKFSLRSVEGAIIVKALESDAELELTGGAVQATFGSGTVNVNLAARSWRGRGAEIQLARGEMNVVFPPDMNADLNAEILRTGKVENIYPGLQPRDNSKFGERLIKARAGSGGASLFFTVGDGTLRLKDKNQ